MNTTQENSQDIRLEILNSLLSCPHRNLTETYPVFKNMIDHNPNFFTSLACWHMDHGTVRDHNEMFVVHLILHPDNELRDVGLALLREMAPYQVERIINFVHGQHIKEINKVTGKDGKTKKVATGKTLKVGLGKNLPRSLVTEITRYLRDREADDVWFDSTVLTARKSLKRLYALMHIAPSPRAQTILFDEQPPEDSTAFQVKNLSKTDDPTEQARLIIEHKIKFRVATSVVKSLTPTVLLALIEVMSSQELINSMGMLRKHGVFENPELKALVESKLKLAESSKKVNTLKAVEAVKAAGLSDDLNASLNAVADKQIKSKGRITRATGLLIDKSSSMNMAIEVGKQLASMISTIMADGVPFYVYAFDTMPVPIATPKDKTLAGWSESFKRVSAGGCTSVGAGMVGLKVSKQVVEQVIVITDEGENSPPAFLKAYNDYCEELKVKPSVHMIRCGQFVNEISAKLERAGIELTKYDIRTQSDYNSLPQIVEYLTKPGRVELMMEIQSYPWPKRKLPREKEMTVSTT